MTAVAFASAVFAELNPAHLAEDDLRGPPCPARRDLVPEIG